MINPYTVGGCFIAGTKQKTVGTYDSPLYPHRSWHCGAGNGLPARIKCALESGCMQGCGAEGPNQPGCGYFNVNSGW